METIFNPAGDIRGELYLVEEGGGEGGDPGGEGGGGEGDGSAGLQLQIILMTPLPAVQEERINSA